MNGSIADIYRIYLECQQKICTDTRKIVPESVFFALKGPNFDANLFATNALQNGCSYAVVDNPTIAAQNERCILVKDVLKTLQELANYHRRQFNIPLIAITGSNGKTTTKELVNAVLSQKYRTLCTPGNFNNHIGLPLTLLQLRSEHQIAVIEMGANHPGEIKELCEIAEPNYGIVTSIGKEHLEGFGNIEQIKKTNGELYEYLLHHNGKIFLHIDNADLIDILTGFKINFHHIIEDNNFVIYTDLTKLISEAFLSNKTIIGQYLENDESIFVKFKWIEIHPEQWKNLLNTTDIRSKIISEFEQSSEIKTHLLAYHNFINALCAVCVGNYFNVPQQDINNAISNYIPDKNRMQWITTHKNNKIILDAYNANPTSMLAALQFFKEKNILKTPSTITLQNQLQPVFTNDEDKILILGDMFELGEYSEKEHTEMLQWINNNFSKATTYLIGKEFCNAAKKLGFYNPKKHFFTTGDFINFLSTSTSSINNAFILIKASRGMQLEKTIEYL